MRHSFRIFALLLSLALLLSAFPTVVYAEDLTDGYYTYTVNEDGTSVTVTDYNGTEAELVIPSTIDGKAVTAIGSRAFSNNSALTSVSIPASVVTIDAMAFKSCSALTAVNITPYTLSIGYQAFHGTPYYTNMDIGPVYIGRCLYGYSGIMPADTVIHVKYGTASISPYAFSGQNNLIEIYLPVGIRAIDSFAFMGCSNLLKMRVPPSVKTIGNAVFLNAGGHVSIYGASDSSIEEYALAEGLFFVSDETLNFPDGDVNRDKAVDSRDLRILMRMLLIDNPVVDEERVASCDLVYDGTIDSADIRAILRQTVGL